LSDKQIKVADILTIQKQKETILSRLKQLAPEGSSLQQLRQTTALELNERSWQRRLSELEAEGKIKSTGGRKNRQYHAVEINSMPMMVAEESQPLKRGMSISAEAGRILELVSQPLSKRKPVRYNEEFLLSYKPNKDFYLGKKIREQLKATGNTQFDPYPAGTYARKILERLLADLAWNSSRLEGNTYSLLETVELLKEGNAAAGKTTVETQMILNHKAAIEFLTATEAVDTEINRYTMLSLHALLSDNLLPNPAASGRLRTMAVGIGGSSYIPSDTGDIIERCFTMILEKCNLIEDPFEQAFFLMVHLPYLQPFDDVNKRVSRLAANIPFIKHNLAPLSFTGVPRDLYVGGLLGVYELQQTELLRDVFVHAYELSARKYAAIRQTIGEPNAFVLQYRSLIKDTVKEIINKAMSRSMAAAFISEKAGQLPTSDNQQLREAIETELLNIHEGNFARFMVTPSAFYNWKNLWDKPAGF